MLSAGVRWKTGRPWLLAVTAVLAVFAGGWLLVLALEIGVPLDTLRRPLEAALTRTLGQPVSIAGAVLLRPTLGPTVVVYDLSIDGPPGAQFREQLQAGRVEARLGLLSLLRQRPEITRLQARDVTVYLAHAGTATDSASGTGPPPTATGRAERRRPEPGRVLQTAVDLSILNLVLDYRADSPAVPLQLVFEQVRGRVLPGQPLELAVAGRLGGYPYSAGLRLPAPEALLLPAADWRLQASVALAGARLELQGMLAPPAAGQSAVLAFDLQGDLTAAAEPAPGPAITGRLNLRTGAAGRPLLGGELQLAGLDLGRLAGLAVNGPATAGDMPAAPDATLPGWLDAVDAALVVTIADLEDTPLDIRDTRVDLTLHDGQLDAPLETRIAAVPFHGSMRLATGGGRPEFTLSLGAAGVDAATLLHGLPIFAGIRGDVAQVALHAALPASVLAGGGGGLDAGMQLSGARLSYGHVGDGVPVQLTLDTLALTAPAGRDMTATVHGSLRNAGFAVELTGGSMETLLQEQSWPLSLSATGRGATLSASGTLTALQGAASLTLQASGAQLGELAPWLGVSACSATPYSVRGQLLLAEDIGRLQFLEAQLGTTRLSGELDWSRDEQVPLLHVLLHVDTLQPADMAGLLPLLSYDPAGAGGERGIRLDLPVLPRPAVLANLDLDLTVDRFSHSLVDITGVAFSGRLRDGVFQHAPFRARVGGRELQGRLDSSGGESAVVFAASADDAEPGGLLDRLFSSAIRWAGNAGMLPLGWLFGQDLSEPAVQECLSGAGSSP